MLTSPCSALSVIGSPSELHVCPVSQQETVWGKIRNVYSVCNIECPLLIKCHNVNVPLFCLVDWEKMRETGLHSVGLVIVQEYESLLAWHLWSYRIYFPIFLNMSYLNKKCLLLLNYNALLLKNIQIWLQVDSRCFAEQTLLCPNSWQMPGEAGWFNDTTKTYTCVASMWSHKTPDEFDGNMAPVYADEDVWA